MCNLKCVIIPVTTGATGIVTEGLRMNLEAITGKHSADTLLKTAILGTSHIIREVLQCETGSLSAGDRRWFKRSTGRKGLTRDDDDDDDNNNNHNKIIIIIIIIIIIQAVYTYCVCSVLIWFAGTKQAFLTVNTMGLGRAQLQAPVALPPAEGVAGTN
jgi:hypothetical protein